MSPPPDFAERVFEARTASARRLWFFGAALFTAAAAITTIVVMRHSAPAPIAIQTPQPPVLIPAPTPSVAPGPMPGVAPTPTPTPAPAVPSVRRGRIAILGIEALDREDVQVARELTESLRARAKVGTGPYLLAPGTDLELLDEKLLNNCDSEAPACMAAIGQSLGADVLMFGRIEQRGTQYQVTLKLLDVDKQMLSRSLTRPIATAEASGADLASAAKRMYLDLTGP